MGENTKLDWKMISHAGGREEDLGPGIELGKGKQRETLLTKVDPPVPPLNWSKCQTPSMRIALAESSS